MNEIEHKKCFGEMFPDRLHSDDQSTRGRVFSIREAPSGGLTGPYRTVEADVAEWDSCQRSAEFESCFKLCIGKVALESSVIRT